MSNNKHVVIEKSQPTHKIYTREEAKIEEGIYKEIGSERLRFVSNGQGEIFIFGDGCLVYKTMFPDLNERNLVKTDEKIYFKV